MVNFGMKLDPKCILIIYFEACDFYIGVLAMMRKFSGMLRIVSSMRHPYLASR